MLRIIKKFKNKNSFDKLVRLLVGEVEKLARLWHVGKLASLLARWHVQMRSWQAFGTWARRPRWHAWHAI